MAGLTAIAALATITASAISAGKSLFGGKPEAAPAPIPEAPKIPTSDTKAMSAAIAKRRRGAGTGVVGSGARSTLLTGASGLSSAAPTERKTLLGH